MTLRLLRRCSIGSRGSITSPRRASALLAIVAAATLLLTSGAWAQRTPKDLAEKLTPAQLTAYEAYRAARDPFERQFKSYWHRVEAKRDARKAKRMLGQEYEAEDYVATQPPKYAGPELAPDIAKIVAEVKPPVPERPLATVADFLANAKEHYGFVPTPTTEREFKRSVRARGAGRRPDQGPGGAHLRAGDRRARHLRHAVGLQSGHQAGQADLVRAGLRAAPARQLDQRARQARGAVRAAPAGHGRGSRNAARACRGAEGEGGDRAADAAGRRARSPTSGAITCSSRARPPASASMR